MTSRHTKRNDPFAIAALATGVLTYPCCLVCVNIPLAFLSVCLGFVSLGRIKRHPGRWKGRGMAVAGVGASMLNVLLWALFVALWLGLGGFSALSTLRLDGQEATQRVEDWLDDTVLDPAPAVQSTEADPGLDSLSATNEPSAIPSPAAKATVREISGEFVKNQLVAEQKFVGKRLTVSGTISKIQKDRGRYVIYCEGVTNVNGVKAYVAESEHAKLASLSIGKPVTFTGMADSFDSYDLEMSEVLLEGVTAAAPAAQTKTKATVREISGEFVKNQLVAEQKFVGKRLTVSGTISKIQKDGGRYVIYCEGVTNVNGVKAYVAESEHARLASLSVGKPVTFTGMADGFDSYDLEMSDCRIE